MPFEGLDANGLRQLLANAHCRWLTQQQQTTIARIARGDSLAAVANVLGLGATTTRGRLRTAGERIFDPLGVAWTPVLVGEWYLAGHDACCCPEAAI